MTEPVVEPAKLETVQGNTNTAATGQGTGGPKLPGGGDTNKPPVDEAAVKAAAEAAAAKEAEDAAKAAADKTAADEAAEAARVADEEAAKAAEDLTEYATLEDPAGQAAIDLLKEAGVTPKDANAIFDKALRSGNFEDIDVAALKAAVGDAKATLIMAGAKQYHDTQTQTNVAAVKAVHEVMGGEANWNTVRDWARAAEKASPSVKARVDDIRAMLDKGGTQAEVGARELMRMYSADPATVGLGTATPLTTGDGLAAKGGEPLGRAEYVTALKAAHAKGAPRAEIKALDARRAAGRAAGM